MINVIFQAKIGLEVKGEMWTCVEWPESVSVLGTGKSVKVVGTVDGYPIPTSLMPTGNGSHMFSLNKKMMRTLNKNLGDTVEVSIFDKA